MAAISEITGSRCGATRQICRSLRYQPSQWPLECRLALLDEGLRRFLVVGGLAGTGVMDRFGVEAGFQRHRLGVVDVALDVAERDRRPLRQRHREILRRGLDLGIRHHLRDHAEIVGLLRVSTGDVRYSSRALALPSIWVRK